MFDLVTMGEAMIRLTPPNFQKVVQADTFLAGTSGSELNTAIGAAQLGLKTCWVSRLVDNPIGWRIANTAREHGVDISHILWVSEGRVGLYYYEMGASTRASRVYYDRRHSAMSQLELGMIDWSGVLSGCRVFHISGITPALSASCAAATEEVIGTAKQTGCLVSLDINYRSQLWSPGQARECIGSLLPQVDILLTTLDDARIVFGFVAEPVAVARKFIDTYGLKVVAITVREAPSVLRNVWQSVAVSNEAAYLGERIDLELVDRMGSGDAYTAGFLFGYLTGDLTKAVAYGDAMSALKHSVPGDHPWATLSEVQRQVKSGETKIQR